MLVFKQGKENKLCNKRYTCFKTTLVFDYLVLELGKKNKAWINKM